MIDILQVKLENCISEYIDMFAKKQDMDFEGWIGGRVGEIAEFADMFLDFSEIRTDLEMNAPKGEIIKWYWENLEIEININYQTHLKLCHRKYQKE